MVRRAHAILIALSLSLGGCAMIGGHKSADTPEARGHATAQRACASCHAVEPGGAASPRDRAVPFASLEMRHTVGLEGRLADLTRRGHYGMPPVALDAGELADLQAYIESLRHD